MKNLLAIFILAFLLSFNLKAEIPENLAEKFDPALARLDNLEKLETYIDSLVSNRNIESYSKEEVLLVNAVIEDRFYHDFSTYSPYENLIAWLSGKFIWDHLNAIVIPDDLLKYPMAACSQQSIVMMAVLKKLGYKVRKLGLNGHFVHEVYYDNDWHLFDPNKETIYQGLSHDKIQTYFNNGSASLVYAAGMTIEETNNIFSMMELGETNEFPAKKARWFHRITKFLSYPLALIVCLIPFLAYKKLRPGKSKTAIKTVQIGKPKVIAEV